MAYNETYEEFVEKFKPKKTTDDCYTPANVYNAVLGYCVEKYGINSSDVVRPFYPGGDYERFEYKSESVVVDNPPFSILSKIIDFYVKNEIKFFLFAPTLTIFGACSGRPVCAIVVDCDITYENGAKVNTSFITNMEREIIARSDPELYKLISEEDAKNAKPVKQCAKYKYPSNIVMASNIAKLSRVGIDFKINRNEALIIGRMDEQKKIKKEMFGKGLIVSDDVAEEAKRKAEEAKLNDLIYLKFSERERKIIDELTRLNKENK